VSTWPENRESKTFHHRFVIGSPAYFVGDSVGNEVKLRHAWGNIFSNKLSFSDINSRSYHMLEFQSKEEPLKLGVALPNYYGVGEVVSSILSVIFGKLFVPMGFIVSRDSYCIPDVPTFEVWKKTYPFFSNQARNEFPIDLDRGVLGEIKLESITDETVKAATLYQSALSEFGRAADVAYINLVTAGEILTSKLDFQDEELYDERTLDLLNRLRRLGDVGQEMYDSVRSRIRQLKRRYVLGLVAAAEESIFIGSEHGSLSRGNLKAALSASYDLRSKYLHEGVRIRDHVTSEIFEVGLTFNDGHSQEVRRVLQRSPNFIALERVIRMAILKRIFSDIGSELYVPTKEKALFLK